MKRKPSARKPPSPPAPPRPPVRPSPASAQAPTQQYDLRSPLICLGLAFLACAAYGELLSPSFTYFNIDDDEYILANPHVNTGLSPANFRWAWTAFHSNNWHPLTWLSLQIDVQLFGLAPAGFRLTNILLHALAAILLFLFLQFSTSATWRSGIVAGLFLLHPLRVESVAWIAERKDVLAGVFWMLALLAYLWYARQPTPGRYLLVAAVFALGLTAKQMLVTLPFVLLLLDWWPLERIRFGSTPDADPAFRQRSLRLLVEKLPLLALAALASLLTLSAQTAVKHTAETLPYQARVLNALVAYLRYVGKTFWPLDLCFLYEHPGTTLSWPAGMAAGFVLLVVSLLVISRWGRRRPYLAVGWFWFLGTLVPVIGLVQVGNQALADRYSYVPQIGLLIMLVWGLAELARRWRAEMIFGIAACAGLAACLVLTWMQVSTWHNPLTVWSRVLAVEPNNYLAHNNVGQLLADAGYAEQAVGHLEAAVLHRPSFLMGYRNLGMARQRLQRWSEAAEAFRAALQLQPDNLELRRLLGRALVIANRPAEAEAELRPVVDAAPQDVNARAYLGLALQRQGKTDQARSAFAEVVRQAPDWPRAMVQGAWLLAADPEPARRNGSLALFQAELAQAAEGPSAEALGALAAAHAELGQFDDAVRLQAQALNLVPQDDSQRPAMQERLQLYQRRQPYRR